MVEAGKIDLPGAGVSSCKSVNDILAALVRWETRVQGCLDYAVLLGKRRIYA